MFNRSLDVLRDHRNHLLGRLTSRSPLLQFKPTAYREDVDKLFSSILPNPPAKTDSASSGSVPVTTRQQLFETLLDASPKAAELRGADIKLIAKCRKIREQGDDWLHSTGQPSIYLGFPLVHVPLEGERYLLAPLLLWNVQIGLPPNKKIKIERATENDEVLEPVFNRLLQIWLLQERHVQLNPPETDKICWSSISASVKATIASWSECRKDFRPDSTEPLPEPATLKRWAKTKEGPRILSNGVIGHCPFKGQVLLDDLDQIIKKVEAGETSLGLLSSFISPRTEKKEANAQRLRDVDTWAVTRSDSDQESAIRQARLSQLVVLHGPPGTGKSQSIVNLVADALKLGKKIAVICQKEAALEVVKKRLDAAGLGDLVLHLNEVSKDRWRTISRIRDIESDFSVPRSLSRRRDVCASIETDEAILDKVARALGPCVENARPRYGDLRANVAALDSAGHTHLAGFSQIEAAIATACPSDLEEMERLLSEVQAFREDIRRCQYNDNPWRSLIVNRRVLAHEADDLARSLSVLQRQLENLGHAAMPIPYQEDQAWLVEHDWIDVIHGGFLPQGIKESHQYYISAAREVRPLYRWLPQKDVERLLPHLHGIEEVTERVRKYRDYVGSLPQLSSISDALAKNRVLNRLQSVLGREIDKWDLIVQAAILRRWRQEHERSYGLANSSSLQRTRSSLRDLMEKKRRLDSEDVKSEYSSRLDSKNELQDRGLTRLRKSVRGSNTSLRDLYRKGFDEIHKLFPVLLTNPDTACALWPLEPEIYDLVIMDEASQMYTSDALPILFRAKRAVVSGDEHQMPPSDFFTSASKATVTTSDEEEEDDDDIPVADRDRQIPAEGEYCILNAAVHTVRDGSPASRKLRVHYRSDFPELIAFSNHAFYGGSLIVPRGNPEPFPFCPTPIVFKKVDGEFDRGENVKEATLVVETIEQILSVVECPSIGVVTFNVKQRDLINALLADKADFDPEFRKSLLELRQKRNAEGEDDSLFVRSVEHVQGDERDLIIFSTTYDSNGTRSFGPLTSKHKGRRRLNVAVTRAKRGIIIVSSLNVDWISTEKDRDLSENYFLWKYLSYARAVSNHDPSEAKSILSSLSDSQKRTTRERAESPFEEDVANFLRESGYWVDHQVGEGGFRIDLGVKRNQDDERYICGLECDGRQFHSDWTARMNDVWRQEVLEAKGWKIVRVWSTDWYGNPDSTKLDLLNQL